MHSKKAVVGGKSRTTSYESFARTRAGRQKTKGVDGRLEGHTKNGDDETPEHTRRKQREHDVDILAHRAIRTHKHHKANTRRNQQTSHHGTRAQNALKIELNDHHAGCAVRNKRNYSRGEHREHGIGTQEMRKGILAKHLKSSVKRQGNHEDEQRHIDRVLERALCNPLPTMVMSMIMVVAHAVGFLAGIFMACNRSRKCVSMIGAALVIVCASRLAEMGPLASVIMVMRASVSMRMVVFMAMRVIASMVVTMLMHVVMRVVMRASMLVVMAVVMVVAMAMVVATTMIVIMVMTAHIVRAMIMMGGILVMTIHQLGISRAGSALTAAGAMILFTQLVNTKLLLISASKTQNRIDDKAHHHTDDDLRAQDLRDGGHRNLLGNEDREHLVRSGKEHRKQRSQGDNTSGIQSSGGGRKTTLGHHAQESTQDGACSASAANRLLRASTRHMLKPLHGQVRDEKERNEIQHLGHRMAEDMLHYHVKRLACVRDIMGVGVFM